MLPGHRSGAAIKHRPLHRFARSGDFLGRQRRPHIHLLPRAANFEQECAGPLQWRRFLDELRAQHLFAQAAVKTPKMDCRHASTLGVDQAVELSQHSEAVLEIPAASFNVLLRHGGDRALEISGESVVQSNDKTHNGSLLRRGPTVCECWRYRCHEPELPVL